MDKKKILIFGILTIFAIICAFGIVSLFSPKYNANKKIENKKVETSQDFIDVVYELKDNEEKQETDVLEKKESEVPISTQNFEKLETDTWDNYLQLAEEYGYDFSDVGNTVFVDYEETLNNESKVSEGELSFLNNLKILADNYTAAYEELFSYVLSNDIKTLESYYNGDYKKTIEDFKTLDTLGSAEFEKIKEDYLNGMLAQEKGFKAYIDNPGGSDGNDLFIESDNHFYNGQQKLIQLLDSYK